MERLFEYAANHPLLAGGLVAVGIVVIANEIRHKLRAGASVSPQEAVGLINEGAVVLDIRAAAQFEKGHVLDARNIPLADMDTRAASLERFKESPVVVYCDTGMSSQKAAEKLRGLGFTRVFNLRGGLGAWRQENLPVMKGAKSKSRRKDGE
jgi:rhodanese-related sulfurtransferase